VRAAAGVTQLTAISNSANSLPKDFVIAMIHSIASKDYDIHTFDRFGIVIYDECHHVGSEQFSKSMMKIRTRFILGLSATPNRRDGLSHVFHKFMGPLFHKEKRSGPIWST